jgi:hypothetical protein
MDDVEILRLFQEWLCAFEAVQADEDLAAANAALRQIETCLASTPAQGLNGLAIKHGLHHFLSEHDLSHALSDSLYRDLVRLSGLDPIADVTARVKLS